MTALAPVLNSVLDEIVARQTRGTTWQIESANPNGRLVRLSSRRLCPYHGLLLPNLVKEG
jgi:hypothetical protein